MAGFRGEWLDSSTWVALRDPKTWLVWLYFTVRSGENGLVVVGSEWVVLRGSDYHGPLSPTTRGGGQRRVAVALWSRVRGEEEEEERKGRGFSGPAT